jgi:type IV pilus assembly protein PilB
MGNAPHARLKLGELLVRTGHLDTVRLEAALAEQRQWGGRLGRVLVEMGFLDERTIARALAEHLGLPSIDLGTSSLPANVTELLPVHECEQYGVMPVQSDAGRRVLRVASSDPTNLEALDELGAKMGIRIEPLVAPPSDIDRAIRRYYYGEGKASPAPEPKPSKPAPAREAGAAELEARVAQLEALVSRQARALRTLIEMLAQSGAVDRNAFVERLRASSTGNGPA